MVKKIAYNSHYSCRVDRLDKEHLLAEAILLTTDQEIRARLIVEVQGFIIREANWEQHRTPLGYTKEYFEIPELVGVEAYLNSGRQMREATRGLPGVPLNLFFECIKGIVQAESYLVYERGHSSLEEYDQTFASISGDSCIYYANPDRVTNSWQGYIKGASAYREQSLFYRSVNHHLSRQKDDLLLAVSTFSDSFHELSVRACFSNNGILTEIQGDFLRAPDNICFEAINQLPLLSTKNILVMGKKELARYICGPCGCTHLLDLVYEMGQTVSKKLCL